MNLTKKQLNNLISLYITEEFKSQAQRKYFYSQANKPGKEGEKWDKLAIILQPF